MWPFFNLIRYLIHGTHSIYFFLTPLIASVTNAKVTKNKTSFLPCLVESSYLTSGYLSCSSSWSLGLRFSCIYFVHHQSCYLYWHWCRPSLYLWPRCQLLHDLAIGDYNCLGFYKSSDRKAGCRSLR